MSALLLPLMGAAEEPAEPSAESGSRVAGTMDRTQDIVTDSLEATVLRLDQFFTNSQFLEDSTESYLRLRPEAGYDTDDDFDWDLNLAARLDLPGTKQRYSLIISSEADDPTGDGRFTDTLDHESDGGIALERNSKRPLNKWRVRPAIGVKGGWLPDPFARLRATRYYNLEGRWLTRLQGTTRYLVDDQWDLRGELDFNRLLGERWALRIRTDLRYRDAKDRTDANQYFTITQKLNELEGISYELAVLTNDDPDWDVRSYRFLFAYRQLIYKDWLFVEYMPELSFREENDYDPSAGIRLRLEAFFGKGRLKRLTGGKSE